MPPGVAVSQILQLLSQPQVVQALAALGLGSAGRESVELFDVPLESVAVLGYLNELTEAALIELEGEGRW